MIQILVVSSDWGDWAIDRLSGTHGNLTFILHRFLCYGHSVGAHGLRDKDRFYEEAVRVSLAISFPERLLRTNQDGTSRNRGPVRVNEPVSHLDLFSTLLDYAGASKELDTSDGNSLRRHVERSSYNERYDENVVVSEYHKNKFEEKTRPNYMIRHKCHKLCMIKKHSSPMADVLVDLKNDPDEINNLIGARGLSASLDVIGKAEHLRILLLEWMRRNDGGKNGYYSNSEYNVDWHATEVSDGGVSDGAAVNRFGQQFYSPIWYNNNGTLSLIDEIGMRRTWSETDLWQSDRELRFGRPSVVPGDTGDGSDGGGKSWRRNEFFYIGRSTPGTLSFRDVTVLGRDAEYFRVDKTRAEVKGPDGYVKIKVSFSAPFGAFDFDDARRNQTQAQRRQRWQQRQGSLHAYLQYRTNVEGSRYRKVKIDWEDDADRSC